MEAFNQRSVFCDVEYHPGIHGYGITFTAQSRGDLLQFSQRQELPYLLPNAADVGYYELPTVYYCLIHAMCVEHQAVTYNPLTETVPLPDIEVTIEYTDVQGVPYRQTAFLHTEGRLAAAPNRSLAVTILPERRLPGDQTNQAPPSDSILPPLQTGSAMG